MDKLTETIAMFITAVVGVAILAVLVSQKSNTAGVLAAFGSAFSNSLSAATGPVTGNSAAPVNNIGSQGGFGLGSLGSLNLPAIA